jgi:hypothetical protein
MDIACGHHAREAQRLRRVMPHTRAHTRTHTRAQAAARLATFAVALVVGVGCASQQQPPGGPPDVDPPVVVSVSPANNSVAGVPKRVELRFDEVISETPRGGRELADLVFISPRSGKTKVDWGRDRLTIEPSKGWKANTVYSIQIKPGISDLRTNALDSTIRIVFSTGGPIPDTRITGVAFDWGLGKGMNGALVEAITPDSTFYQAFADTAGRFELRNLPTGPYRVRAYADRNSNRELDPLELWDSTSITLTAESRAELYAFQHDTVGLRITEVAVLDSNRLLKVTFDKPYNPNQFFVSDGVSIKDADSTTIPIKFIQTAPQKAAFDSAMARAKADSVARASGARADTSSVLKARQDSIARVRRADSVAAAERARRDAQRAAARLRGGRVVQPDTLPLPKMNRPPVYTELYISLLTPLPPQKQYRLRINGMRSLGEVTRNPVRTFSTPKRDTTTARPPAARDTTRPPATRPPIPPAVRRDTMTRR